jgi:hypothetical protein
LANGKTNTIKLTPPKIYATSLYALWILSWVNFV